MKKIVILLVMSVFADVSHIYATGAKKQNIYDIQDKHPHDVPPVPHRCQKCNLINSYFDDLNKVLTVFFANNFSEVTISIYQEEFLLNEVSYSHIESGQYKQFSISDAGCYTVVVSIKSNVVSKYKFNVTN